MIFEISYSFLALGPLTQAAIVNVLFAVGSVCIGFMLALAWTGVRLASPRPVAALVATFLVFIRGTPLLIQIFLIYFLMPSIGIDLSATASALLALTLHTSAFITEIVRGGLNAVPLGQYEATKALGLGPLPTWGRVILPQMTIKIIPPLINEFVMMMKATPLVSAIAVTEALRTAQQIFSANFRALETLAALALIFFCINFAISRFGIAVESRLAARSA